MMNLKPKQKVYLLQKEGRSGQKTCKNMNMFKSKNKLKNGFDNHKQQTICFNSSGKNGTGFIY